MAETEIASQDCNEDLQSAKIIASDEAEDLPELPSRAVEDLFSLGVCGRCVLRLFGIRWDHYSRSSMPSSILKSVFGDLTNSENHKMDASSEENQTCCNEVNMGYCSLCFGILQFAYCDDKGSVVSKASAYDFAASIADLVKQEGYLVDKFSLEVSIPTVIQENDLSVWLSMKKKYASDPWFQSKVFPQFISVKDSLKSSITGSLEELLECKSNTSTLHIRLTYSHPQASTTVQSFTEKNQGCKRRKTVISAGNVLETDDDSVKCSDFLTREVDKVVESSSETHQDGQVSDRIKFTLEEVAKPCQLVFQYNRTNIYFGGRYLKFSRNVSQTRWIIDDERMGEASVEELIGSKILPACRGDNYKFHAAGREDIDVRMLGSGRPFLVEVQNAHLIPSEVGVKELEKRINDSENKLIGVKNLKIVGNQGWTMMREGESEKQKQYTALVWISRPLVDEDFHSIASYKEMHVLQKTPIRVLHRRSPLDREKIIHWMRMEKIVGSSQYFLLHLCTQAGTYIKEFVHGDLGRTHPSIGSLLGCRAEILQLDVTDVKMDCFHDE